MRGLEEKADSQLFGVRIKEANLTCNEHVHKVYTIFMITPCSRPLQTALKLNENSKMAGFSLTTVLTGKKHRSLNAPIGHCLTKA